MNIRQLRTVVAIADQGSLSAAGRAVGLTHSAISLQVKSLEAELGVTIIDRSRRPPVLTPHGIALVGHARNLIDLLDQIAAIGRDQSLIGTLTLGVVPTAMVGLVPPALARLRRDHPRLVIEIRVGLSGDLAAGLQSGDLDAAVSTAPESPLRGLVTREILREPLVVLAPAAAPEADDARLLSTHPYLWFNRRTWAGQQIERRLAERGVSVDAAMEVDSLEAIDALVRHGLGVSVVPHRRGGTNPGDVRVVPFGDPPLHRVLVLMERHGHAKSMLTDTLLETLRHAPLPGAGSSSI